MAAFSLANVAALVGRWRRQTIQAATYLARGVAPVMAYWVGDSGLLPLAPGASSEKRGFHSKLATCGGGHIHVPDSEPEPEVAAFSLANVAALVGR